MTTRTRGHLNRVGNPHQEPPSPGWGRVCRYPGTSSQRSVEVENPITSTRKVARALPAHKVKEVRQKIR